MNHHADNHFFCLRNPPCQVYLSRPEVWKPSSPPVREGCSFSDTPAQTSHGPCSPIPGTWLPSTLAESQGPKMPTTPSTTRANNPRTHPTVRGLSLMETHWPLKCSRGNHFLQLLPQDSVLSPASNKTGKLKWLPSWSLCLQDPCCMSSSRPWSASVKVLSRIRHKLC